MAQIACPNCAAENDPSARFCIQCGTRLSAAACAVCGTVNPVAARFCMQCGNNLAVPGGTVSAGLPGSDPGADGARAGIAAPVGTADVPSLGQATAERRLVSVLFVDLVGFTTASERRDAEDTRDLLSRYYEVARDIVGRYGGTIEKFIGDAVMAVWGTPSAHEDDAERAVRAALELVNAVPRLEGAGMLEARAGVLTGEAAVAIGALGQGMVAGDLVNTASRLQSVAEPGTVLVGDATYRAASRAITFQSAGERELKGKEQAVPVWEAVSVVARRGGEGRAAMVEPPFVGRDDELQLLKDQFHSTVREGKPRLVTLSGIAGIGKSRLFWELEKYLDGVVERVFWHAGRSPAYGEGISYWALAEMIRGRAGIVETDDQVTARANVDQMLTRFLRDETERRWIEPRVLGLLGLEALPADTRDELFAAWRTLFERIAEQSPVVLGFWDLHWADQGMLDFIEHVLGWARSSPILVLAEARPELFDRRPDWGRSVRTATLMHLDPLGPEEMRGLLAGLVPDLPAEPMRRIVERAEGIPLYAVETLRMLLDRGVLEARGDQLVLTGALPELAVPETLHALIASRLDALTTEERGLLADGSVLGLSFTRSALIGVSGLPEAAINRLTEGLARRELLTLDADPRSPERGQYRFLQAVVREVAYQSIARKNRQVKHLAAARYFESLGEDELAGVLATHYHAAHQAAPAGPEADAIGAQARVALRAAADRASALHDLVGALTYVENALSVTPDPKERAALHERAVTLAGNAAFYSRGLEHGERAVELYVELGDRLGVIRTRAEQADVHHMEHHDQIAVSSLRQLLADAEDLGPAPAIAHAQAELARALMLAGEIEESIAWSDRVLANPDVAAPDVVLEALITKGTTLSNVGRAIEAQVLLRGAVEMADSMGNLPAGLRARNNLRVLVMWSNLRDALALTVEVRDIALRYGNQSWVQHATSAARDVGYRLGDWDAFREEARESVTAGDFYTVWAEFEENRRGIYRGDPVQAEALFDAALATDVVANSAQATTWNLAAKADALIPQGRFREAFALGELKRTTLAEKDLLQLARLFAAAAAGDVSGITGVRDELHDAGFDRLPAGRAYVAVANCLVAALEGRWQDALALLRTAEAQLEQIGEGLALARFRLALGHLAGDQLPEAATAAASAEAWFAERGAAHYVPAYRAVAMRTSPGTSRRGGAAGAAGAGSEPPASVRAGG